MKISAQEIIIVALVVMAILLVTRVIRIGRNTVRRDEDTRSDVVMSQFDRKTRIIFDFFIRLGIALTALGGVLIILSLSWFKWALQSYLWSIIIIVIGVILILVFRRRK